MKKVFLVFMSVIFIMCLVGCKIEEKTELHFYTKPHVNYQSAEIIYELYGDPTKIIDGFYFEKDDIVLNIKYGWNEEKIEYSFANVEIDNYKLICFVSYICLERYRRYNPCDDYKNFDKSILIEEIDKEVFLSDYYKANFGKSNFFKSEPPIFSEENEGIKLKLTPEYLNWIEESTENYSKKFYFAVVPIYYDSINNKYLLYFGSKYDGIEIEYHYDEEKKLVYMNAR